MGGFLVRTEEMRVRFPLGPPDYVGRGRVAQASDCDSLHESSILSGQPSFDDIGGAGAFACQQFCSRRWGRRFRLPTVLQSSVGQALSPANSFAGVVQRKGQNATNVQMGVRFPPPVPSGLRPTGKDAALRTLKCRFESGGLDQSFAVVAERQRRLIVYQDQDGSTPFHRAMGL